MKVAAAESAVLDSAATKEKEAHKRLQAVQEHAELLAKEKRATREAMQKALALQAEAREKIAQSEALLAQYGLADVAPQPTPAPEASKAAPIGGVRAMSAYQSNGKVKPPTNVASSTTSIKIAEKAPPAPCSRMGAMHKNEGTPTTSAVHAFGNEHSGASLNAKGAALGRCDSEPKLVQGAAPGRGYTETKIIKRQRRLSKCRYISSVTRYIPRI